MINIYAKIAVFERYLVTYLVGRDETINFLLTR